jgi:hypothetical protein
MRCSHDRTAASCEQCVHAAARRTAPRSGHPEGAVSVPERERPHDRLPGGEVRPGVRGDQERGINPAVARPAAELIPGQPTNFDPGAPSSSRSCCGAPGSSPQGVLCPLPGDLPRHSGREPAAEVGRAQVSPIEVDRHAVRLMHATKLFKLRSVLGPAVGVRCG